MHHHLISSPQQCCWANSPDRKLCIFSKNKVSKRVKIQWNSLGIAKYAVAVEIVALL